MRLWHSQSAVSNPRSRHTSNHSLRSSLAVLALLSFLTLGTTPLASAPHTISTPFHPPYSHPFCTPLSVRTASSQIKSTQLVPTTGTLSLVYIRVRYPDDPIDPLPLDEAKRDLDQATAQLDSMSFGQCRLLPTITPVFSLPRSRQEYSQGDSFALLLNDARAVAQSNGIDYTQFQLDIIRHTGLPNLAVGSAFIGERGLQLAAPGPYILLHELGHNLGLHHANFWDTDGPELPLGSPPLPSDFKKLIDPNSIPVHPNSALGQPSLTGPGQSFEYGDPWDIMGSGADAFSMPNRLSLGWINPSATATVTKSTTLRLYAPPSSQLSSNRIYVVRIPTPDRELWMEMAPISESSTDPALILRWRDPEKPTTSDLLQPTLAFVEDPLSRTLKAGQTFSDRFRNLHVTGLQAGITDSERWIDVAIEPTPPGPNRPPTVTLQSPQTHSEVGVPILFNAQATDPDGDPLTWHWDFDDSTTSLQTHSVQKAWSTAGDYTVQVTVTDRKGGIARSYLVIQVGSPSTARLSGRITDELGKPIPGARVHSLHTEGKIRTFRWMLTDDDGRYTLTRLTPGTYTNGAFAFGYHITHPPDLQFTRTEQLHLDYQAQSLPRIHVSGLERISESSGLIHAWTISRTGPTHQPLSLPVHFTGTATPGIHYTQPPINSIIIPAGASQTTLALEILDAPGVESSKTVQLHVDIPPQSDHTRPGGSIYTRYFPGFDLETIGNQMFWTLTDPLFIPGPPASLTILDDDLKLSVLEVTADFITLKLAGDPGMAVQLEESPDLQQWSLVSSYFLPRNGSTEISLPHPSAPRRFYKLSTPTPL